MLKTMYDIYIDINAQISKKLSANASSLQELQSELMDVYFVIKTDTDRIFPDARREAVR